MYRSVQYCIPTLLSGDELVGNYAKVMQIALYEVKANIKRYLNIMILFELTNEEFNWDSLNFTHDTDVRKFHLFLAILLGGIFVFWCRLSFQYLNEYVL